MNRSQILAGALAFLTAASSQPLLAQQITTRPPAPSSDAVPWGQRIEAKDGDVILIPDDARVRIVRRRQVFVRAIANTAERWVVVLADYIPANGQPDGRVDRVFTWREIEGAWPLGERWEGGAYLEEYTAPSQSPGGIGFVFPVGRVQLLPGGGSRGSFLADPGAIAVLTHHRATSAMGSNSGFDEAEQRALSEIASNTQPAGVVSMSSSGSVSARLVAGPDNSPMTYTTVDPGPATGGPVRVGGNIPMPRRIVDVAAVYPERARQAGIRGVVILELTIGTDGSVSEVQVLRGQPLLDQAAVDAARQWRYEPTLLGGKPVPVRLTATVNVQPQ